MSDDRIESVRTWMAEHYPQAEPWQVGLVGQCVESNATGRRFSVSVGRRCGLTTVRDAARRYLDEHGRVHDLPPLEGSQP